MYPAALSVWLLGPTITAVRAVPALASALALLPLYWVARVSFGPAVALVAAALYAVLYWPLHLARIAFPVGAWPLLALLAVAALVQAVRQRRPVWWLLAGGAASLGLYVYHAHSGLVLVLALFVGLDLAWRWRRWSGRDLVNLAAFGAGFLLVALPLLLYVADPRNNYVSGSWTRSSLLLRPAWQDLESPLEQARLLASRYRDYWQMLCCRPNGDTVDGTGAVPVVPLRLLGLALVGALLGLWRRRTPLLALSLLIVLLLPVGAILTTSAFVRRTLAVAPLLALLAGLGVVELVRLARAATRWAAAPVALGLAALLAVVAHQGLEGYFLQWPRSELRKWVFAEEFYDAVRFLQRLPSDSRVYFYSERWSFNYEPRRFLAAGVTGEDRSNEFGGDGRVVSNPAGRPVFIFMGKYRALLNETRRRYPDGVLYTIGRSDKPSFEAYIAPVQPP
jgi:4-amino-4-deoxy-L-arabinose transferase-like glycosyltransferase